MNNQSSAFQPAQSPDGLALGTGPIPAKPYYCPEYFDLEREAIFRRSWLQVGHVCELLQPGDFIRREIEVLGASILIMRHKDGSLRAFHNACPHRGTQIVKEEGGRKSRFSCPYHMWTFGTDGALISAPDFDKFYVEKADCGLKAIDVDVCGGMIFVNLDKRPERQSLRQYLGEDFAEKIDASIFSRVTHFHEYTYEIAANWKLTYDNFQENYHLRFIHPKSGAAASGKDNPFGYPIDYGFHGQHRTQSIWSNPEPEITPTQSLAFGRAMQFAAQDGVDQGVGTKQYFALFPNIFMFCSAIQPFSHTVYPIAANQSRGVIRVYWIGPDDSASKRFAREYLMATARDIHAEDRNVIEAGQRGLSSGALDHIHFMEQEVLCRHLMTQVSNAVEAYKEEIEQ